MNRVVEEDRARAASKNRTAGTLVLWRTQQSLLPMEDLARVAGLHITLVERLVDYGVIEPVTPAASPLLFPISAIDRLRRIMRLRRDLGVNLDGAAVILEMKEHLARLEAELDRLRGRTRF